MPDRRNQRSRINGKRLGVRPPGCEYRKYGDKVEDNGRGRWGEASMEQREGGEEENREQKTDILSDGGQKHDLVTRGRRQAIGEPKIDYCRAGEVQRTQVVADCRR
jgi:hypothetical protein